MAKLIWTEPALAQLDVIAEFIALDKPAVAKAVVRRVFDATDRLEQFTKMGRPVPELEHTAYREVWLKPCWVYYRVAEDTVYILHIRRGEKMLRVGDLLEDR
jgi:plasmid stabilization system protein ParE